MDARALKILHQVYRRYPPVPPSRADFEYAREQGLMFEPRRLTHDAAVRWVIAARARVTLRQVSDAFIASLGTQRLQWRAAFASFVVARHLPSHPFRPSAVYDDKQRCGVCGWHRRDEKEPVDLSEIHHSAIFSGSIYGLELPSLAFNLERFAALPERPAPGPADFALFDRILRLLREVQQLGSDGKAHRAEVDKGIAKIIKSGKYDRMHLLDALGYSSLLAPPEHPGHRERFIPYDERGGGDSANGDWDYPFGFWRAIHGIDLAAQRELFPQPELAGSLIETAPPTVQKGVATDLKQLHPLLAEALSALPAHERPPPPYHLGDVAPEIDSDALLALAVGWIPHIAGSVPTEKRAWFDDGARLAATPHQPDTGHLGYQLAHDTTTVAAAALGHLLRAQRAKAPQVVRGLRTVTRKVVAAVRAGKDGLAQAQRLIVELDAQLSRLELDAVRPASGSATAEVLYRQPGSEKKRPKHEPPREAVWVARLVDGSYGVYLEQQGVASWIVGRRDDVLANVPDGGFATAVSAVLAGEGART